MEIVLINIPSPGLSEPWVNYQLGLGYIASFIEQYNYKVTIWDLCAIKDINSWTVPETSAEIFGLSITTPQFKFAEIIAKKIKEKNKKSVVVAGGPHTLANENDFYINKNFDSVVIGEGEIGFFELIRDFEISGKVKPSYKEKRIKLIDNIPFPARHLFPNFKENALKTHVLLKEDYTDGGQTTIISDRGCNWGCSFCGKHPRTVRRRSVENVISEVFDIIDKFGIYQFKWQTDTMTANKKWILELCNRLEGTGTFHRAHTRVDVFDEEIAAAMAKANFKLLCFGIESFDQRVLDINNKKIKVNQIEKSLKIAKNYGFKILGLLIYGLPGENKQSVETTKMAILRNKKNIDYLNLTTMVPFPGTPIAQNPEKFGCEILSDNYNDFFITNHDWNDTVLVKTNGVSIETMRKLKTEMYQFLRDEGYSRPEWK